MKCPECGTEVPAGVSYCRECGAELDFSADAEPAGGGTTAAIPLMVPGETLRNVLVGLVYLAFLPITVACLFAYAVGTNRNGLADRLADSPLGAIPTIENGGWQAAFTVFVVVLSIFAVAGAALPDSGERDATGPTPTEAGSGAADHRPGETPSSTETPLTDGGSATDGGSTTGATTTPDGESPAGAGPTQRTATATGSEPASASTTSIQRSTATRTARPTATSTATSTAASSSPASQSGQRSAWTVTVVSVIDGDTMDVRMPDGSTERIRLLGVDTPETSAGQTDPREWAGIPDTSRGREWLESWGGRATEYAESRLGGEEIYIETDPESDRRGTYDRLLVYASQSESAKTFDLRLIENGYARMYDTQFEQRSRYQSAESTAQSNDVGVWDYSAASTSTPSSGESQNADGLVVANVHADADGDDHDNLNDEYVEFTNEDNSALDLGGWTVSDEADHTYRVPSGFTLEPDATVTLYTGRGENTDDELYWGESQAVWNNGGDTIYVRTDDSELVIEHEYSG